MRRISLLLLSLAICSVLLVPAGCQTPSQYRQEADKAATDIIREKQRQLLNKTEDFSIERPSDILRRRLLVEQDLPYASEASLGTDRLKPVEHWPEEDYQGRSQPTLP